jgi:hypothetical protein
LSQLATCLPVLEQQASPLEHFLAEVLVLEHLAFSSLEQDLDFSALAFASLLQHFFASSEDEHFLTVCSTFTSSDFEEVVV